MTEASIHLYILAVGYGSIVGAVIVLLFTNFKKQK